MARKQLGSKAPLRQEQVTPFDLFMIAVTLLSLVNLILYVFIRNDTLILAITIIDVILSTLFLGDFIRLFTKAQNKKQYFFKEYGWADLIASVPFPQFNILRIFRLIKAYGIVRRAGWDNIRKSLVQDRASSAIFIVLFTIILLLEFGSVGILAIETRDPGANIKTASDALWWVYVTITTVGYGDRYPVTNEGRILGAFVMLVGVGLFGVVTGYLANKFLSPREKKQASDARAEVSLESLQNEVRELRELIEKKRR